MTNRVKPITGESFKVLLPYPNAANAAVTDYKVSALVAGQKKITNQMNLFTDELPDLDNLSAPSLEVNRPKSRSFSVSGDGLVHETEVQSWKQWFYSGATKKIYLVQESTNANAVSQEYGDFILTKLDFDTNRGEYQKFSIEFKPSGEVTYSNSITVTY